MMEVLSAASVMALRALLSIREQSAAAHLDRGRGTSPLFDPPAFARDFERLLADAYDEITAARMHAGERGTAR